MIVEINTAQTIDSVHAVRLTESPSRARPQQQTSSGPNRSSEDPVVAVLTGLFTPLVNHLYSVLVHHGIARSMDIEPSLATTSAGALRNNGAADPRFSRPAPHHRRGGPEPPHFSTTDVPPTDARLIRAGIALG